MSGVAFMDGMLVSPQLLQTEARAAQRALNEKTSLIHPYLWGVRTLQLDRDLLKLGKFGLESCTGLMADGTFFDLPHQDPLPEPLTITETLLDKVVYLGLPVQQPGSPDTNPQEKDKNHRYYVRHKITGDRILGYEDEVSIPLLQKNWQLFLQGQDLSKYTCLPIAYIKEAHINQEILLDEHFLPPCLNVNALPRLKKFVEEIHSLLHHRGQMLSQRLTQAQQSQTAMVLDLMLLQVINHHEPEFATLSHLEMVHPLALYQRLITLLGDLSTFTRETRRAPSLKPYHHYHLTQTYQPVIEALRRDLSLVMEQHTTAIPLVQHQQGVWLANIENKALLHNTMLVLAVHAEIPLDTLAVNFPRQAKVAPVEQLEHLITRQLPGIELQRLSTAPRQIPFHANYLYFLLNKKHETWQYLEKSAALAIYLGADYPDPQLELWAIKE